MIVILAPIVKLGDACEFHCKRVHGHNIFVPLHFYRSNIIVDGRTDQIMTTRYLIKGAGGLSICTKASTAQVGL